MDCGGCTYFICTIWIIIRNWFAVGKKNFPLNFLLLIVKTKCKSSWYGQPVNQLPTQRSIHRWEQRGCRNPHNFPCALSLFLDFQSILIISHTLNVVFAIVSIICESVYEFIAVKFWRTYLIKFWRHVVCLLTSKFADPFPGSQHRLVPARLPGVLIVNPPTHIPIFPSDKCVTLRMPPPHPAAFRQFLSSFT